MTRAFECDSCGEYGRSPAWKLTHKYLTLIGSDWDHLELAHGDELDFCQDCTVEIIEEVLA